jgi:hypothetical protein
MTSKTQSWRSWVPQNASELAVWVARLMTIFALQGVLLLTLYAIKGPSATSEDMPVGTQLDRIHSVVHLVWGVAGAVIGLRFPAYAQRFVQAFAVFYLILAISGTFTPIHYGMQLEVSENVFHWSVGTLAVIVGFVLPIVENQRKA